jgi:hypothetical protein
MMRILIAIMLCTLAGVATAGDRLLAMSDLVGRWVVVDQWHGELVYEFTMNGLLVEEAPSGERMHRYYLDEGRLIVDEGPGAEGQWRVLDKTEGRLVLFTPGNKRLELSRRF